MLGGFERDPSDLAHPFSDRECMSNPRANPGLLLGFSLLRRNGLGGIDMVAPADPAVFSGRYTGYPISRSGHHA